MTPAGEGPSYIKVLTQSYLTGAPLSLPGASFKALFPVTTEIALSIAAGKSWQGRVTRRQADNGQKLPDTLNITAGWGSFAKSNGLRVGDKVEFRYEPGGGDREAEAPAIVITLLSRDNPVKARTEHSNGFAGEGATKHVRSSANCKAVPRAEVVTAAAVRSPLAAVGGRKRPRREIEKQAHPQLQQQQRQQLVAPQQAEQAHQQACLQLAVVAAGKDGRPPFLALDEPAYIRYSPPAPQAQQQQVKQRNEGEERRQLRQQLPRQGRVPPSPYSGTYELPPGDALEAEAVPQVASRAPAVQLHTAQQAAGLAASSGGNHAQRAQQQQPKRCCILAGPATAADAAAEAENEAQGRSTRARGSGSGSEEEDGECSTPHGGQHRAQAAAAAGADEELLGAAVLLRCLPQYQLHPRQKWLAARVVAMPAYSNGAGAGGGGPGEMWVQPLRLPAPVPANQPPQRARQERGSAKVRDGEEMRTADGGAGFGQAAHNNVPAARAAERAEHADVARMSRTAHTATAGVAAAAASGEGAFSCSLTDVAAVLPHGLVGWTIKQRFPGFGPRKFTGTLGSFSAVTELFHVRYEDGDQEELELPEVLIWLAALAQPAAVAGTAACTAAAAPALAAPAGRKRGPAPRAVAALPPPPPLRSGDRGGRGSIGDAPSAVAAAGGAAWVQVASSPSPEALAEARDQGGFYAAGGAGHERGALAYDKEAGLMRPVGRWIADSKKGTVLARNGRLDKRYLPNRQLPGSIHDGTEPSSTTAYRSSCVPGWIGVSIFEDEDTKSWHPAYEGQYHLAFWDKHCATRHNVLSCKFETVEEAARMYDRLALCYYGETADTNYPPTQELLAELGPHEEGGPRQVIPLAARLLLIEQSLPDGAVAQGVSDREWRQWEDDIADNYLCSRPTAAAPAALAARLKWLLQQVAPAAVLPSYRGAPLRRFFAACDACTEAGTAKDHYAADASRCLACASHSKAGGGKSFQHDCASCQRSCGRLRWPSCLRRHSSR